MVVLGSTRVVVGQLVCFTLMVMPVFGIQCGPKKEETRKEKRKKKKEKRKRKKSGGEYRSDERVYMFLLSEENK